MPSHKLLALETEPGACGLVDVFDDEVHDDSTLAAYRAIDRQAVLEGVGRAAQQRLRLGRNVDRRQR